MARLTFHLHYATRWGESLWLEVQRAGPTPDSSATTAQPMHHAGDGWWTTTTESSVTDGPSEYRYICVGPGGEARREPLPREMVWSGEDQSVVDQWLDAQLPDAAFLRRAFAGVIFNPDRSGAPSWCRPGEPILRLTLRAPQIDPGYRLCVSGSQPLFGDWNPERALVMSGEHYPRWEIDLPLAQVAPHLEYKFGLWSQEAGRCSVFEQGANRRLDRLPHESGCVVVNHEHFRTLAPWKGAGVAIPVFALRSERSYGVGEFADLEPFAAWAARCGMNLIQVLPVNDTTASCTRADAYPYKAISTAALHPLYLNLDRLFDDYGIEIPRDYAAQREALNRLSHVDYETVMHNKRLYLRQVYAQVGATALSSPAFTRFWRAQADWLRPYAAFCLLRDRSGTTDFSRWGEFARYSDKRVGPWFNPAAPEYADVMFHAFVQYHLKEQLDRALAAGHALGIAFKGDLPIGVNRGSVEAWTEPELFRLDRQTGAPPDAFAERGQNWGFPTYHWPHHEAQGYAWWQRRLQRMAACFDALRIDHILGFFRIWEIPGELSDGILGHFSPARPLTRDEIRDRGFTRDPDRFAVPAVTAQSLTALGGEAAAALARELLAPGPDAFLRFRPEYESPAARAAWCARTASGEASRPLAQTIERLSNEVLFIADPDQPERFHPRIALTGTALYRDLDPDEQAVLRELHDDFFYRRHTRFWEEEAMKKLPVLMEATRMLICGEDLGMVPDAVPIVLKRLGLLSLEVQSLPKRPGERFGNPQTYPYLSVCTTSTHDTPTLRGWWEENPSARAAFYHAVMGQAALPPNDCTPDIARFILDQNLRGASMWCILPLQDWLAIDPHLRHPEAAAERINIPANPHHDWRYRLHLTMEDLGRATAFNRAVRELIAAAGRGRSTGRSELARRVTPGG